MSEVQVKKLPRVLYRDMRSRAEEIEDEDLKERILAGIKLLNDQYGPGWVDHVDPMSLTMSSCRVCVLGQVYGDYTAGMHKLEIDVGYDYGFDTDDLGGQSKYKALTIAWRRIIS